MRVLTGLIIAILLAGCATSGGRNQTSDTIHREMEQAVQKDSAPANPDAVSDALLPPLGANMPKLENKPLETRFDLALNNTPASQVFPAIVSNTRYSVLLPSEMPSKNLTLMLKDVTVFEALEAIREMYRYDYKVDGTRIYITPPSSSLQTQLFKIDYLAAMRDSSSSLSVKASGQGPLVSSSGATGGSQAAATTGNNTGGDTNSSHVSTTQKPDEFNFWKSLEDTLKEIVKQSSGSVMINRMSGVVVVRAMPDELQNVKMFLEASRLSIERQVIIEAKFVEVVLNDSYQSGINWAGFMSNGARSLSAGGVAGGTLLPLASGGVAQLMSSSAITAVPGSSLSGLGLAFQTSNFAAMLNFLETQGNVHVLSSPRIATLNNQKAVLKVGTDEPYATGFTPATSTTVVGGTNTLPTPVYSQLFSGIALDVTPRINESGEIILHVHPSISQVTSTPKDAGGGQTIQMASISIEETDSVVRAKDGQIVVIGGLMSQTSSETESGLPGFLKNILGLTTKVSQKRELVIMLKTTVVDNDKAWSDDIARSRDRMNGMLGQGEIP